MGNSCLSRPRRYRRRQSPAPADNNCNFKSIAQMDDDLDILTPPNTTPSTKHGEDTQYDQTVADSIKTYMEGVPLTTTTDKQTPDELPVLDASTALHIADRFIECYELGYRAAQSAHDITADTVDHCQPFSPHMSIEEANALRIGDGIDFRLPNGKFVYAHVSDKRSTYVSLQYESDDGTIAESECDFIGNIYRFARPLSISHRSCTDSMFMTLDVNDTIDINPIHTAQVGWKIGRIIAFEYDDAKKLQVQIEYNDGERYWTHLDNRNEVQMLGTHTFDGCIATDAVQETETNRSVEESDEAQDVESVEDDVSDGEYVLHKEGAIERYKEAWIQRWDEWEPLWMELNGETLQFFEDENKRKIVYHHNLKEYTNIIESGTISFSIYKGSKEEIQCRVVDAQLQEREEWIKYIKRGMGLYEREVAAEDNHIIYPKHNEFFIQTKFSNYGDLKCRFVQNDETKHAELVLYDKNPEKDNDSVIRIDLVRDAKDKKKAIVRLQGKSWGDYKRRNINNNQKLVCKPLPDIIHWCIEYQNKYPDYSEKGRNCRLFMYELCEYLEITYPDSYLFEAVLYKMGSMVNNIKSSICESDHEDVMEDDEEKETGAAATQEVSDNDEGINETLPNQWACPQCTLLNNFDFPLVCDVCAYEIH